MKFQKHIFKSAVLNSPADQVWELVQPTNMSNWMSSLGAAIANSDDEEVDVLEEIGMRYTYRMDVSNRWPVRDYSGEIEIVALTSGQSEIKWNMVYVVDQMHDLAADMMLNTYMEQSLKDVRKYLSNNDIGLKVVHMKAA